MQRSKFVIVVGIVLLVISGCGGERGSESLSRTLDRGLNGSPESLDPHKVTSSQAGEVLRDLGEGLTTYSRTGALIGGAAERWEVDEDGLTYTFHLREDGKWSNGHPILAEHFVYAFRRLVNPSTSSPAANYVSMIAGAVEITAGGASTENLAVLALGPYTLQIRLTAPTPYFLQLLTNPSTFPVFPDSDIEYEDGFAKPGVFVSNGAYELSSRSLNSLIELVRNEHYWDNENTWFDTVRYHIVNEASEITRFRAGELDVTNNVSAESFELMREELSDELVVSPALGIYYYGFNLKKSSALRSKELRQALSMAIDREALVQFVTKRGEEAAYSWVPPGIENYSSQEYSFKNMNNEDRENEALKHYKAAGYGDGNHPELELRYNTLGGHQNIAIAIQSMWKDVLGLEVSLVNEEFKVLLSNVRAMDVTEIFRLSWNGDYNDAQTFLQLFSSNNPQNLTAYSNPEVDDLLEQASATVDLMERRDLLQASEKIALSDYPVIPLYFYVTKHMVADDINGWSDHPLDYHYSRYLSRISN